MVLVLIVAAAAAIMGGSAGLVYGVIFVLATLPGWRFGRLLFGPGHPASWVAGGLIGYGLTTVALWVPIALHVATGPWFFLAWIAACLASSVIGKRPVEPLAPLPDWDARTTRAFVFTLMLVPAVMVLPYRQVGHVDAAGGRSYRAYFTADFVWHEALTAELARFEWPPRNPYVAAQPLHYYWGYFVLPSVTSGVIEQAKRQAPIESILAVNNLGAGLLFIGSVFVAAFAAVRRAVPVAVAVSLVLVSASTEGLYEVYSLWQRGIPLSQLRGINIDAVTAWFFYGLTIDGLPRSLWWGPQHATASALGLVAVTIAICAGATMPKRAAAVAGTALGLALLMSPFPAGSMTLVYGLGVLSMAVSDVRTLPRVLLTQLIAVAMVLLGLGWSAINATFEGAGSAVELALSRAATRTPLTILGLALGPVLVPALTGLLLIGARRFPLRLRPAVVGIVVSALLFFFVTLVLEPIWIGWRAGHLFLISAPAAIGVLLAALYDRAGRVVTVAVASILFVVGLPTTVIDIYNAQDTTNLSMGPGFRWTVRLTAQEDQALTWIKRSTPSDAVVQMSLEPRGRETWSLVPSFARRRMAAGLPISLLRTPDYDARARVADGIFSTTDVDTAVRQWRDFGIDYLYIGRVERDAFPEGVAKFGARPDRFGRVFSNDEVAIYVLL